MYKLSYALATNGSRNPEQFRNAATLYKKVVTGENSPEESIHKVTIPDEPLFYGVFGGEKDVSEKLAEKAAALDFSGKADEKFIAFLREIMTEAGEKPVSAAAARFDKNDIVFLTVGSGAVYRFQDETLKKIGTKDFECEGLSYHLTKVTAFEGDRFVLATDGLYNNVTEADLQWTLSEVSETVSAAEVLLKTAEKKTKDTSISVFTADILRAKWSIFGWK